MHRVSTKPNRIRYDERKSTASLKAACWKEDEPMKILPCVFSALTAAAVSLVFCSSSFADTPQTANLTIENHQRLVTVKDDSGKWLFAQVITTPDLEVSQAALGNNLSRVSLQDASGKTLWTQNYSTSITSGSPHGEWSDKFLPTVDTFAHAIKTLVGKDDSMSSFSSITSIAFVIGPEDQLKSFHGIGGKHHFEVIPNKVGFGAKMDGHDLLVVLPQPAAAPAVAQASTP